MSVSVCLSMVVAPSPGANLPPRGYLVTSGGSFGSLCWASLPKRPLTGGGILQCGWTSHNTGLSSPRNKCVEVKKLLLKNDITMTGEEVSHVGTPCKDRVPGAVLRIGLAALFFGPGM